MKLFFILTDIQEKERYILMLIKTPIVCLLFTIYMLWFYYRKPHIPIRSTRIFQMITSVTLLNVLFDLITLYTVNHREQVPEPWNLLAHIVYLLSILGYLYLLFIYMRSYLEARLKFSRTVRICQSLPVIISALGILTLPITYVHGKTTDYSLGPKAYALYGSVIIYLILILYYCLRYWEIMNVEKRMAILLAVPIFVIISLIQMVFPETLLEVVAATMILLGLMLSNENTEKYMDEKTSLFNQYSFEMVLEEFDFEKQKINLAVLCFCKTENNLDWKQDHLILQDICRELRQRLLNAYHVCENGVVFISSSKSKAEMVLEEVKNVIGDQYGSKGFCVETHLFSGEDTATKHGCMQKVIAFCTETGARFAYIDYLTHIYNRNALERDLENVDRESQGCYIIADLNNLKVVNDTIGHSAGDELLQGFAGLLEQVVGNNGRAYRQGGDEFAVLYRQDAQEFVRELAGKCRECNQSRNVPISYAIGYSGFGEADFIDMADQRMYENKRKMKQQQNLHD